MYRYLYQYEYRYRMYIDVHHTRASNDLTTGSLLARIPMLQNEHAEPYFSSVAIRQYRMYVPYGYA